MTQAIRAIQRICSSLLQQHLSLQTSSTPSHNSTNPSSNSNPGDTPASALSLYSCRQLATLVWGLAKLVPSSPDNFNSPDHKNNSSLLQIIGDLASKQMLLLNDNNKNNINMNIHDLDNLLWAYTKFEVFKINFYFIFFPPPFVHRYCPIPHHVNMFMMIMIILGAI